MSPAAPQPAPERQGGSWSDGGDARGGVKVARPLGALATVAHKGGDGGWDRGAPAEHAPFEAPPCAQDAEEGGGVSKGTSGRDGYSRDTGRGKGRAGER
jgi:hypothetical protein